MVAKVKLLTLSLFTVKIKLISSRVEMIPLWEKSLYFTEVYVINLFTFRGLGGEHSSLIMRTFLDGGKLFKVKSPKDRRA